MLRYDSGGNGWGKKGIPVYNRSPCLGIKVGFWVIIACKKHPDGLKLKFHDILRIIGAPPQSRGGGI